VGSSWMATVLDQEQIEKSGGIASRPTSVESMPDRTGVEVATELGQRLLVRYLTPSQVSLFVSGSTDREHWVTPTAIAPNDLAVWLTLFAPRTRRRHALLLDPVKIDVIRGPAWVRLGQGIEYFLPDGFPADAVLENVALEVR
jgi:hypothetical protein